MIEDYSKLDEYLETKFIPKYIISKSKKNNDGKTVQIISIESSNIIKLLITEKELKHILDYLKERNIYVYDKDELLATKVNDQNYMAEYRKSSLEIINLAEAMPQKIKLYKENNDEKLREEIIKYYMNLIPYLSRNYIASADIDISEIYSYGYEGLIVALDKFNINYDNDFLSFALPCIKRNILLGISEILNNKRDSFFYNYINAKNTIEKRYGLKLFEDPQLIDKVIDLLVTSGKMKDTEDNRKYAKMRINSLVLGNVSLDDEETREELINSEELIDSHDYIEEILSKISTEELIECLKFLPERYQMVLRLKFDLDDNITTRTYVEIGKMLGISGSRVRQIVYESFSRLRWNPKTKKIVDPYNLAAEEEYYRK